MTISNVIERHAPLQVALRRQKRVQQKPWLTKGLLVTIKNKQKLYKCYFLNGNELQRYFFKKYANKLTRVKNLAKKFYYKEKIAKIRHNPKALWKLILSVIPSKRTNPTTTKIISDNVTVENQSHIAKNFNQYFVKIGRSLAQNANALDSTDFRSLLKNSVSDSRVFDSPQPNEIYNAINTLNINKHVDMITYPLISCAWVTKSWHPSHHNILDIF